METPSMLRYIAPLIIGAGLLAAPASAAGLFDKAKDLLQSGTGGSDSGGAAGALLSSAEVSDGLKEALRVGAEHVTADLGATNGFFKDPVAFIPLPDSLKKARDLMKPLGLSSLGDEVELRMNRGAEAAMPAAKEVLVNAISNMTLDDAKGILNGPDDAATQYLKRVGGGDIESRLRPIIDSTLRDVGAIQAMDAMLSKYKNIPFAPDVTASLTDHATEAAMGGLFHYIAQEEAAIRENPAKRTTDLLQKVFAQ
ncbi:DUF4197 domain-containing protein [Hwanghaeella grinnelliae]|uniref:DUF4197 domain-containing protein n=2 Tax=Hwanghaeella grinnelliae TaxID=2500179 RepID=A0A3S2VMW6_9PROT|nr:DUF4197 domain-containing protein [Hwanghaeella grinnelliae]